MACTSLSPPNPSVRVTVRSPSLKASSGELTAHPTAGAGGAFSSLGTGRPKVASVMKTSQGTATKAAQVGSGWRL